MTELEESLTLESFQKKSVEDLVAFLEGHGIEQEVLENVEDEAIDGEAFLELSEDELKSVGKKIGIVKKLRRLKDMILCRKESHTPSVTECSPLPTSRMSSPLLSPSVSESEDNFSLTSASSLQKKLSVKDFQVPDTWRPSIMQCIQKATDEERRLQLDASTRCEIVRDLVTQMFSVQPKPTSDFASSVAKKLVRKYPFMRDIGDKVSGHGSWERKIIERINNQVASANRKRPRDDDDDTTPRKRGRPKFSTLLQRYPTLSLTEDDCVTIERNMKKLKEESVKLNPLKSNVLPLQRSTFATRREFILSGLDRTDVILEEHPVLKLPFAVEIEMDLILGQSDSFKKAKEKWAKLVPAIVSYSESFSGKFGETLKKIREDYEDNDNECAFVLLVNILGKKDPKTKQDPLVFAYHKCKVTDDPDDVIKRYSKVSTPTFASFGSESIYLFVEGVILFKTSSLEKAILLWFSVHYVLNMHYAKPVNELCLFLQEYVFMQTNTTKKTATYLAACSDILKYIH